MNDTENRTDDTHENVKKKLDRKTLMILVGVIGSLALLIVMNLR
jgi:hypothetical protein